LPWIEIVYLGSEFVNVNLSGWIGFCKQSGQSSASLQPAVKGTKEMKIGMSLEVVHCQWQRGQIQG